MLPRESLPTEIAVSTPTLAELAAGTSAAADSDERERRRIQLQRAEKTFEAIAFGIAAAHAYGRIYASVRAAGRVARGRRALDLLIAATALAAGLPLYTENPDDFRALDNLIEVSALEPPTAAGEPE